MGIVEIVVFVNILIYYVAPCIFFTFTIIFVIIPLFFSTGKAKKYLQEALACERVGNYNKAIELYTKGLSINSSRVITFNLYFYRGTCYRKIGDSNNELKDLSTAISREEREFRPQYISYYERGNTYMSLGRYNDAIEDYEMSYRLCSNASDLNEMYAVVNGKNGIAYKMLGDKKNAKSHLEQALKNPEVLALEERQLFQNTLNELSR